MKVLVVLFCAGGSAGAQSNVGAATGHAAPLTAISTNRAPTAEERLEQIRTTCIRGRRTICGRVMQVLADGLVIESGYRSLLRPPLTQSWVVPGTVSATRDANTLEGTDPGAVCLGLLFLTDLPKSPQPKQYDYVIIQGYPAGEYSYTSVPSVTRTIRKFAAGLETAVRLTSSAGKK